MTTAKRLDEMDRRTYTSGFNEGHDHAIANIVPQLETVRDWIDDGDTPYSKASLALTKNRIASGQ